MAAAEEAAAVNSQPHLSCSIKISALFLSWSKEARGKLSPAILSPEGEEK